MKCGNIGDAVAKIIYKKDFAFGGVIFENRVLNFVNHGAGADWPKFVKRLVGQNRKNGKLVKILKRKQ